MTRKHKPDSVDEGAPKREDRLARALRDNLRRRKAGDLSAPRPEPPAEDSSD